jgi:hypothetical protein
MKQTRQRTKNNKTGPPEKIRGRKRAPAIAAEPFDALHWTDTQRELQRSLAELHQLAARCHLARICRELLPEAQELAQRGRPRLLATLARILAEPALDVSLPPPAGDAGAPDDAPVQIELIHNVSRPIRNLDELTREQQRLGDARKKLLTK